jgi:hypothetical protein
VGVVPDIEVPDPTAYERSRGIDPQLQKAIDIIKDGQFIKPATSNGSSMVEPAPLGETGWLQEVVGWFAYNWDTLRMPA